MTIISMRRFLPFLFLLVFCLPSAAVCQRPSPSPLPPPPKPNIAITFERQAIKESDAIQARVWFSNEWDQTLSNVTLHIDSPTFLTWNADTCGKWSAKGFEGGLVDNVVNLNSVAPNEVRVVPLCMKSGSGIVVGDFNVSFTFEYSWPGKNNASRSFVMSEKTLKANLFGSDSVAGVPIALAAFIVPGLFFWLVIGLLKLPWSVGPALGDKVVYSVIASLGLLGAVNFLRPDPSGTISLQKLFVFALAGCIAGVSVGGADVLRRWLVSKWREARAKTDKERAAKLKEELDPKLNDSPAVLLGKLLKLHPNLQKPRALVRLGDNTQYQGTLMAETDEVTALVGSFRVSRSKIIGKDREAIIAKLENAKLSSERFGIATEYRLEIEPYDSIIEKKDGAETETDVSRTFNREGTTAQQFDAGGVNEPLVFD